MFSFVKFPLLLAQAAEQVPAQTGLSLGEEAAIILAVIAGSFALGHFLSKWLRMPDYSLKIGFVLSTLLGAIAINILLWPPKLGIDLSGGVVLVYEIDQNQMQESSRGQVLDQLDNQLGTFDGQKLKARLNADKQIEIPLPAADAAAQVRKTVKSLSTRGVLNIDEVGLRTVDGNPVLVYELPRNDKRVDMEKLVGAIGKRINPSGVKEVTVRQYGSEQIEIIVPEVEQREVDQIKRIISTSGNLQFRILANDKEPDHKEIIELAKETESDEVYQGGKLQARWIAMRKGVNPQNAVFRTGPGGVPQVLVLIDDYNVDGDYLSNAAPGVDEHAQPCITFAFNSLGALKFGQLTADNVPRTDRGRPLGHELGIVLDNELQSAATIRSQIRDRGQITGSFDEDYVNFVVNVLNSGSLPAALQKVPISEQEIGAQLGADTIQSGKNAMIISTIAVVLFMLIYYRFAGVVADVAVIMNMVLAVALMLLIKAAFTLPGLAGLVLTVGMAVDANVLIYERMREELAKGASLRMAIRNGFSRAMATIIDSHMTTVSTAVVLFAIGTDQIKGFAISLILGLAVSLYTAVYVARVIFDVFERKRWLTQLRMMQFIGETHFNFVRWRGPAIAFSLVVIGIGMIGVYERGSGLLDIDFNGGTSVQLLFSKGHQQEIAHVRQVASNLPDLEDVSVSAVGKEGLEFKVDTAQRKMQLVQQRLKEAFQGDLATYSMTYDHLMPGSMRARSSGRSTKPDSPAPNPPTSSAPASDSPQTDMPADKPEADANGTPNTDTSSPPTDEAEDAAPASPANPKPDKPAADKPGAENKPEPGKGAQRLIATDRSTLLALADDVQPALAALLLAQAPDPADAPDDAPAKDTAASQTEGETAKQPASDKPAAKQPLAENPANGKPAAGKSPLDALLGDSQIGAAPRDESIESTPSSTSDLHFAETINRPTLSKLIEQNLSDAKLPAAKFALTNSQAGITDNHAFSDWTLAIDLPMGDTQRLLDQMQKRLADTPVFPSSSTIGSKVAGDTTFLAIEAMLASLVMIVLYLWLRFQSIMFGLAAVVALIHDVAVTIGFLALSYWLAPFFGWALVDQFKISLAVVAALLTIVGYSINDTIVIFDRIREIRGKNPDLTEKMINDSVNQTLGRTLLTSGTVLIGTLILYFVGGQGIHPFAYAMLVGLISGTYSTVYIASPVLLWLKRTAPGEAGFSGTRQPASVR